MTVILRPCFIKRRIRHAKKILNDLLRRKNAKNKECLLIKGTRQVGKTYTVEEFGKAPRVYEILEFTANEKARGVPRLMRLD